MAINNQSPAPAALPLLTDRPTVHFVEGREDVMRLSGPLIAFSERCGQTGAMQDLGFFLSKPGAMARVPHLLLVSRAPTLNTRNPNLDDLLGLLLIFEYRPFGLPTGGFATNDRSGRSTLITLPSDQSEVLALMLRALLKRGAHLILISLRHWDALHAEPEAPLMTMGAAGKAVARWTKRERIIPGYLPLAATYDATLATIGQRTRSNLRYYRRRAEKQLGCTFLPEIKVSREEVLEFNQLCMYAVSAQVAAWRYDSLRELSQPVLMGMKDGEGRWLGMLGGRRYGDRSEILWQLNRDGLAVDSLSAVMRSYFIEHEIAHGSKRLYIEGGTGHPIRFSFVPQTLTDLAVVRHTTVANTMTRLAKRYISPENELSHMLDTTDLKWQPC